MSTQPSLFKYDSIDIWGNNPTPYTCECGSNTTLGNKFKHNRTLKHQAYLRQEIHRVNGTLVEEEPAIINVKKDKHRLYMREYYELNKDIINKTILNKNNICIILIFVILFNKLFIL